MKQTKPSKHKTQSTHKTLIGVLILAMFLCVGALIFALPLGGNILSAIAPSAKIKPLDYPAELAKPGELANTGEVSNPGETTNPGETASSNEAVAEQGTVQNSTIDQEAPGTLPASQRTEGSSDKEPAKNQKQNKSQEQIQAQAQEILQGLTLEEKVGQLFVVRCPDLEAAAKVAEYKLGGYILFGRDFAGKSRDQVIQEIQSYQEAADIPLFIGVDEEGGTVNRVSLNPALRAVPFWSPQDLYAEGGWDLLQSDTEEKCELLLSLGINLNMAPVCDISQNPADFIYQRSLGQDAETTATYVDLLVKTMAEEGVASVLKHFPGYGNNVDTHTGVAYDQRPYETFLKADFLPFQAGIRAGANMVLVSHNVVASMDPELPASLSPRVHEILREDLAFTGVIITDDLAMEGVRSFAADTETAVMAVQAGNDILCCTDFEVQLPAVLEAVQQGEISQVRLDESVLRILELKITLGIL